MMLKILFLSWNFPPAVGGIEYVAKYLFYGLRERGIDIKLITKHCGRKDNNGDIFRSNLKGLLYFNFYSLFKGLSLFVNWKFDLIVCGSIVSALAARIISLICRRPYIILMHGSDVLYGGKIYKLFFKYLVTKADLLCANSLYTKKLLLQIPCEDKKIKVLYPGLECEKFAKSVSKGFLKEYDGRIILLTVGRLVKRKGVLEFIENVMPKLVNEFPEILYLIVGEDATQSLAHKERLSKVIQERIDSLNLGNHVSLLGNVSENDLIKLYLQSDIFVLPCISLPDDVEGFGIVVLEAAICGTPSIATRTGGIPEAVIDGKTGLLVDASNYDGMVQAISKLIKDNHFREYLAGEAKKRVNEQFCWDFILSEYFDVFYKMKEECREN